MANINMKFSSIKCLFILICLLLSHKLIAQNYIRNGSFENMFQFPSEDGHFEGYVSDWSADRCECPQFAPLSNTHSPDMQGKNAYFPPGNFLSGPHSGDRFASFGNYEIIEQNINILPNNEKMIFTMYIKLENTIPVTFYSSSFLKVYLAKQKIKYKKEEFCVNDYSEYKDPFPYVQQNIVEVFSTPINISIYPVFDSWYEIQFVFSTPSSGIYDWIGIDLRSTDPSTCNDAFLAVDDISLIPLCVNFCVDPDKVPATFGYYNNGVYTSGSYPPLAGVGYKPNGVFYPYALYIENATRIKFEILSNASQAMYSVEYLDYAGIVNPGYNDFLLIWDGKVDLGGCLQQGIYAYTLLIENCVSYYFNETTLAFLGPHVSGCRDFPSLYNSSVPNCCPENEIYNFTSFSGDDRTDVNNLISAGVNGNVSILSGANIVWHAGADIILVPFFQANQGSDFEASIVPCGTLRPNKIEIDDRLFNYNSNEYGDSNIELSLFPNPTAGIVNVNTNLPIVEVEIFNFARPVSSIASI